MCLTSYSLLKFLVKFSLSFSLSNTGSLVCTVTFFCTFELCVASAASKVLQGATHEFLIFLRPKINQLKGGSPGVVVIGDDSCSRGRGFKSLHHTLAGHDIFTLIC